MLGYEGQRATLRLSGRWDPGGRGSGQHGTLTSLSGDLLARLLLDQPEEKAVERDHF